MRGFLVVNLFIFVFVGVIGGAFFVCGTLIQSFRLSEDVERVVWPIGALVALLVGGLLMKQLHAMIQRRL